MDQKLAGLIRAKVTLVVNLMEENETDHLGHPFFNYSSLLNKIGSESQQSIRVERFPIRDQSIPTVAQMHAILSAITKEIEGGGTVFVHCWGGKGRTATVVGCYMLSKGLETQDSILVMLRRVTAHASEFFWPTPQTQEQCEFVTHWTNDTL